MADAAPQSPLDQANSRIRDAAGWLVAGAVAVGAALIAGTQLSGIGRLNPDYRLWVAAAGALLGLTGVVYVIRATVQILLPKPVPVADLAAAWDDPGARVAAFFRGHPRYLQGFDTPAEVIDYRDHLVKQLARLPDPDSADAMALTAQVAHLDSRIAAIEDMAAHQALKLEFKGAMRRLLLATPVAAAGIVAFTWAANPPPAATTADLHGARLVNAYLRDADLRGARLDGADLTGADLRGADLTGASLTAVTWRATTCPDGVISDAAGGTCAGHLRP
ncbi:pentapeptide repeat-containing protein [Nonomuraea sp. NPDC050536]|uniref:pentapeptide repeat-containing protein n=1 Tax=Nonomuraea sp. NPDC050536 TaxID=3364366 RepID=UPI0037C851EE